MYLTHRTTKFKINATHSVTSHRDDPPQLWGDFIYMVPPFIAYYAVASGRTPFLEEAIQQCLLYHDVLETNITLPNGDQCNGLWRHIVSQPPHLEPGTCCHDPGVWLTSNAWALAGMTRVLATVLKWQPADASASDNIAHLRSRSRGKTSLINVIAQMLHCLMSQAKVDRIGLLKNYLDGDQHSSHTYQFGDAAGTALATSAIYRLAVLLPGKFSDPTFLEWADSNYHAVARCVGIYGIVSPVASVDGVPSKVAASQTSEGQSMTILMYAARRDCVQAGICSA